MKLTVPTFLDSLRDAWEKLSDRERRMLSILGAVFSALLVFAVVWTTSSSISEIREERDAIRAVLADIDRASNLLAKRQAERKALEARLEVPAPALAAFVESKAKSEGLEVRQVVEEPEETVGRYRRQSVRASFSGVSLRPVMHLLAAIEDERAPLAIERLVIEHYAAGDNYKVDVGVAAFDAKAKTKANSKTKEKGSTKGTAP